MATNNSASAAGGTVKVVARFSSHSGEEEGNPEVEEKIPLTAHLSAADRYSMTSDKLEKREQHTTAADGGVIVNSGQDDEIILWGYERDMCKTVFTWIFIILSIGALRLIFYWKPNWFIRCTHRRISLSLATQILLKDTQDEEYVEIVMHPTDDQHHIGVSSKNSKFSDENGEPTPLSYLKSSDITNDERMYQKYFISKKVKYVFNRQTECYEKLGLKGQECEDEDIVSNTSVLDLAELCVLEMNRTEIDCSGLQLDRFTVSREWQPSKVLVLRLNYNKLTVIPKLSEFTNLQELDLSHNRITQVAAKAFNGLSQLRKLNLEMNDGLILSKATVISSSFSSLTNLKSFRLKQNSRPAEGVDYDFLSPLYNTVEELFITGTPVLSQSFIHFQKLNTLSLGGEGCNIPSLTEHTYRSITRLGLKRLSARNCNCSQVSSSFLQKFQSTLQKLDLSCNPLRHSFANIVTGISNSNLSVLLLNNINRIPKPGELYCPWNIASANLRPLKNAPLKIFSFHSNQLGDYGDLKLQLYAPGLIYLDVSYNNFHGPTNLLVVDTNKGKISHNSSLAHHITYQPLGLKYVGLRGLITTTPPCGIPPKYRIHCNDDSYLFLDDKFYWDANHEPDIVDFRLLRDIRRAYLKSGKSLGMIYSCTKAGNSLHSCFQSYPTQALSLLPCLSGLEQCFSNDDIQQLSRCFQGQNNEFCGATFLFNNQHVVSCSKQNFDLPNTSLLELLQFYTSCLKDADGTCSSMAPSILRKLKFKACLVKELTELSVHRRSNGLPTFHDDRLINETVYKLIIIDSSKIAFNVTQNIGYIPPNITTLSFGDNRFWESGGVTLTHLNRSCVNRTFYRNNLETADLSHTSLDFVLCRNIRGFPYLTNVTSGVVRKIFIPQL